MITGEGPQRTGIVQVAIENGWMIDYLDYLLRVKKKIT